MNKILHKHFNKKHAMGIFAKLSHYYNIDITIFGYNISNRMMKE